MEGAGWGGVGASSKDRQRGARGARAGGWRHGVLGTALGGQAEPKALPPRGGEPRQEPSSPTPFSVGSPPKFSSTYQSDSHSQCGEGSATPSSGRCWSPLTSLHGQRSLGRSVSQKPPTGFQRWGPEAETSLRPSSRGPPWARGTLLLGSRMGREQRAGPRILGQHLDGPPGAEE